VKDRKEKGERLAAASHGAGEDVASLHGDRYRVGLDGRGASEAQFFHTFEQTRMQLK
jgi:hypothetical protein